MRTLRTAGKLLLEALREWVRDRCDDLAAAMAFNAILGAPALFAALLVGAWSIFGEDFSRSHVVPAVRAWIGPRGETALVAVLGESEHLTPSTLVTVGLAGGVSLLVGASGYLLVLQDALETMWGVRREEAVPKVQIVKRLRGLLYAFATGCILLMGFAVSGAVMSARGAGGSAMNVAEVAVTFLISWTVTTFWFKTLPPVRLTFRDVVPWTALLAGLITAGRIMVSLGVSRSGSASVDVASSIVMLMLWFFYSGLVILYVAQLMRLDLGRRARPVSMKRRWPSKAAVTA